MNEELKIVIKAVTGSAKKGVKEVSKELDGLKAGASKASGKFGAAMKAIGKVAATASLAVVGAITAIGAALVALGKSTLDFNKRWGQLISAFQATGASTKQATKTFKELYSFMGDSDTAIETATLLSKITNDEQKLAEWTEILMGVFASFPDSLPIEGLAEASNETIRVGKVTGVLADALNWAGESEDAFNAKLAQCSSLQEREALVRSTLNGLYGEAAALYRKNNEALIQYNESQANLDLVMAEAGRAVLPLMTALNNLSSSFFTALTPAINAVVPVLVNFINIISKAVQWVVSFFSALSGSKTSIKTMGDSVKAVGTGIKSATAGSNTLANEMDEAATAAEKAKKSTQGFDELNIVSSGSSGGSGGSGSSPSGGGDGDGGVQVEADIEQTESSAETMANKVSALFTTLGNIIADLFSPSVKAWSEAFGNITAAWEPTKNNILTGINNWAGGLKDLYGYMLTEFIPNVTNSFSENLAPMITETLAFSMIEITKHFAWLGEMYGNIVNDILIPVYSQLSTVLTDTFGFIGEAWATHGAGFLEEVSKYLDNLRGIYENIYNNVILPIFGTWLQEISDFWENDLSPLVDKVINAILNIGENILILYNEIIAPIINWIIENVLPPIVTVINTIISVVYDCYSAICTIIGGIIDIIDGIIEFIVGVFTGDWDKAWQGVQKIFSGIIDIIKGVIDYFLAYIKGFCKVIGEVFKAAWDIIVAVWEVAVEWFQGIWDGICGVFSVAVEWFSGIFSDAWEGIKGIWNGVGEWFSGVWEGIKKTFANIPKWFKEKFSEAWTAVKNVFSTGGKIFSGIKEGIAETFKTVVNGIIDGINKVIKVPFDAINKMLNKIRNISFLDISPFKGLWKENPLSIPQIPKLAKGGIIDSTTIAMIGEAGKEAVVPLENNTEWMDALADKIASRSSSPSKIVLMLDGRELGWANINSINGITKQTGKLQLTLV